MARDLRDKVAEQGMRHCIGCGALVPDVDGPTHAYIGASPGCWAAYGDVLAVEFGEFQYPECHRLTVDAYAAQHPGTPSPQSIQSVAVHLISIYLVLERGLDSKKATKAIRHAVSRSDMFAWLDPPPSLGPVTILDVRGATELEEHDRRVRRWAQSVWSAWSPHQETIRRWARGEV